MVSPLNSRAVLGDFIKGAKKQLLVYDPNINDPRMLRLLAQRAAAGVDVRILGKNVKTGLNAEKFPGKRLHVRAIIRDGQRAFLGSQSLRALELDQRREIGALISDKPVVKKMAAVFEADWALTPAGREAADAGKGSGKRSDADESEKELTAALAD